MLTPSKITVAASATSVASAKRTVRFLERRPDERDGQPRVVLSSSWLACSALPRPSFAYSFGGFGFSIGGFAYSIGAFGVASTRQRHCCIATLRFPQHEFAVQHRMMTTCADARLAPSQVFAASTANAAQQAVQQQQCSPEAVKPREAAITSKPQDAFARSYLMRGLWMTPTVVLPAKLISSSYGDTCRRW